MPHNLIFPDDKNLIDLRKELNSLKPCNEDGFCALHYTYTRDRLLCSITERIMELHEKHKTGIFEK